MIKKIMCFLFSKKEYKAEDEQCPVCGYYCIGNGGVYCIDKPSFIRPKKEVIYDT